MQNPLSRGAFCLGLLVLRLALKAILYRHSSSSPGLADVFRKILERGQLCSADERDPATRLAVPVIGDLGQIFHTLPPQKTRSWSHCYASRLLSPFGLG